jgi:AraC family transcriptional regulator
VAGLSRAQLKRIDECVQQPGKPPAVAALAAECGLSTRHFFRLFKAATGRTLTAYVTDRKIERARQLLRPGGPPIKVIAWECGFQSAAAFSAAFRKAEGLTPRQFREALAH